MNVIDLDPIRDCIGLLHYSANDYLSSENVAWLNDNVGAIVSDHMYHSIREVSLTGDLRLQDFLSLAKDDLKGNEPPEGASTRMISGRKLAGNGWLYEREFIFDFKSDEVLQFKNNRPLNNQFHRLTIEDDVLAIQYKLLFV